MSLVREFFKSYEKKEERITFIDHLLAQTFNLIQRNDFRGELCKLLDKYNQEKKNVEIL